MSALTRGTADHSGHYIGHPRRPARRVGLLIAVFAGACLCAVAALALTDGTGAPAAPVPSVRALTGMPCPLCGATRTTTALMGGDLAGMWQFNFIWPLVLVAALLVGTWVAVRGLAPRWSQLLVRHQLATVLAVLCAGWAVALLNRGAIVVS